MDKKDSQYKILFNVQRKMSNKMKIALSLEIEIKIMNKISIVMNAKLP